jgi:hypothetical protein
MGFRIGTFIIYIASVLIIYFWLCIASLAIVAYNQLPPRELLINCAWAIPLALTAALLFI